MDRLEKIPEGVNYIKDLKTFLEAAINLMKKKYLLGVDLLNNIGEDSEVDEMVKNLVYSYRAFGNFSLGKIKEAFSDYEILRKRGKESDSDIYNMYLCKGIQAASKNNFKEAKISFNNALNINKKSVEPKFYLAMLTLEMTFNEIMGNMEGMDEVNFKTIVEVIKDMEDILKYNDSSANLYFQLGKLKLITGSISESINCFDTAIEKSEDHISLHFYWKGLSRCMAGEYENSLADFSTANEIEKEAFKKEKNEENEEEYLNWIEKRCEMLTTYGKAFLFLRDYDNGVRIFEKIEKFKQSEYEESPKLKEKSKLIFEYFESKFNYYLGCFFYLFGYNHEACKLYKHSVIEYSEKTEFREDALLWLTKCYITEKNLVRALEMLEMIKEEYPNPKYSFDYAIMNCLKLTSMGDFSQAYTQFLDLFDFEGLIFKKEDVVFYSGICLFYSGDFSEAKKMFEKAANLKYGKTKTSEYENEALQRMMMEYLQDEAEEHVMPSCNQTFTKAEIYYNCAICSLKLEKFDEALSYFEKLGYEKMEEEGFYSEDLIQNLTVFIAPSLKKIKNLIQSKIKGEIDDQEPGVFEVEIFPSENRLCGIYNHVFLEFSESVKICIKLSFCLPFINLPDISISKDFSEVKNMGLKDIENRPEAPWIKRNDNIIIFTDNFIEDEAYYVEDVEELMSKFNCGLNREAIKNNVELIFQKYKQEMVNKEEKAKGNFFFLFFNNLF